MIHRLNCPNCSASINLPVSPGGRISCPYCHTLLMPAEDLLVKPPESSGVAGSLTASLSRTQEEVDHRIEFIREMAQAGNKIVAVKALRDVFKINKNKAQELVDAMARGELVETSLLPPVPQSAKTYPALDPVLMQKLLDLVRKGEKIEAIKLFRRETGAGLKDARELIEGLEENISASPAGSLAQTGLDLL